MLNLLTLEDRLLAEQPDHPIWQQRGHRALKAAADLLRQRLAPAAYDDLIDAFWAAVPDAWMEANTWAALAARNQALLDYVRDLPADQMPPVAAMHAAYFSAAPTPPPPAEALLQPALRSATLEEVA